MTQTKKSENQKQPFYSGMPYLGTEFITPAGESTPSIKHTMYGGDGRGYFVSNHIDPETGLRIVQEYGDVVPAGLAYSPGNVTTDIRNYYDQNGNMVLPGDTAYYVKYPWSLNREITDPDEKRQLTEAIYENNNGNHAYIQNNPYTKRNTLPEKRQGGYLRLQKQGGKLTEVWTPFN